MNILFSINEEGIERVEEELFSLHLYNEEQFNIFVIHEKISPKGKKKLTEFVEKNKIGKVNFIQWNNEFQFPLFLEHTSKETYLKLFAPFFLPAEIDRILYLDYDIVCTNNIRELYERDFNGKTIVGIYDFFFDSIEQNYINAGVYLIDCNRYKSITTPEEIMNYIDENVENLEYQDQSVLNGLLREEIELWDAYTYNYQIVDCQPEDDYAYLVHYTTSKKPWKKDYNRPEKALPYYKLLYLMGRKEEADKLSLEHFKNQFQDYFKNKKISYKETVDIIMPSYNATSTIRKTLDSILNQVLGDLKITVYLIDDASDEDYTPIVKEYENKLDLRYYRMDKNSGVAFARQRGIDESSGEYFTIIDSDDQFASPYSVQAMYCAMQLQKVDVVRSIFLEEKNWDYQNYKLYRKDNIACHGKLYKREFLQKHNIRYLDLRGNEDTAYNALLNACGAKYYDLNMITYYWRDNPNSFTRGDEFYHEKDLMTFAKGFVWTAEEIVKRKDYIKDVPDKIAELLYRIYLRINDCWMEETKNDMFQNASQIYFLYRKETTASLAKKIKEFCNNTNIENLYFGYLDKLQDLMFENKEYQKLSPKQKKQMGELFLEKKTSKKQTIDKRIITGKNVRIDSGIKISGDSNIYIGENTIIEEDVKIDTNHHAYHPKLRNYMYTSEVHIGKNVFIGRGTYIKAGVQIGDNAFIEEYSVVLSDIEENSIASGNPCTKKYSIDRFDETFYDEDKKIKWDEIKKEE